MKKRSVLSWLSPALASVQIYALLPAFVAIGPIAATLKEKWIPISRAFWDVVFEEFEFFNVALTNAEKDALTAMVFFAPLALTTIFAHVLNTPDTNEDVELKGKLIRSSLLRSIAFVVAIAVLVVISPQIVGDSIRLLTSTDEQVSTDFISIIAYSVLIIFALFVFSLFFIRSRISFWPKLLAYFTTGVGVIEFMLIVAPFLAGAFFVSQQIGPVRTWAVVAVVISIFMVITVRPVRLLQLAGVVLLLVLSGYAWELAMQVNDAT